MNHLKLPTNETDSSFPSFSMSDLLILPLQKFVAGSSLRSSRRIFLLFSFVQCVRHKRTMSSMKDFRFRFSLIYEGKNKNRQTNKHIEIEAKPTSNRAQRPGRERKKILVDPNHQTISFAVSFRWFS